MKELYHPNVITLKHAFYTQGDKVSYSTLNFAFLLYFIQPNYNIVKKYQTFKWLLLFLFYTVGTNINNFI